MLKLINLQDSTIDFFDSLLRLKNESYFQLTSCWNLGVLVREEHKKDVINSDDSKIKELRHIL